MLVNLIAILLTINVPAPDPAAQVNSYFKSVLTDYDDFKVEMVNSPENIASIEFLERSVPNNKGTATVPAEVTLTSGIKVRKMLSFHLRLYKKVFKAADLIEKKTVLNPEMFNKELVEITRLNGTPAAEDEIFNSILKKNLQPGQILLKEYIGSAPLVKAGDKVTANVCYGSTVISFDVYSRQDGCKDAVISVASQDKKLYKAKVIDQKNVTIIE